MSLIQIKNKEIVLYLFYPFLSPIISKMLNANWSEYPILCIFGKKHAMLMSRRICIKSFYQIILQIPYYNKDLKIWWKEVMHINTIENIKNNSAEILVKTIKISFIFYKYIFTMYLFLCIISGMVYYPYNPCGIRRLITLPLLLCSNSNTWRCWAHVWMNFRKKIDVFGLFLFFQQD